MKPTLESIKNVIQANHNELKKFGVREIFVFGSVARGEATNTSDVDMFVDFGPEGANFFTLIDLTDFLSLKLNVRVDLSTKRSLHPLLRDRILQEAVRVA